MSAERPARGSDRDDRARRLHRLRTALETGAYRADLLAAAEGLLRTLEGEGPQPCEAGSSADDS